MQFALGKIGQRAETRASISVLSVERNGEGANLSAYRVRRFAPQSNEIGRGRDVNAGASLQGNQTPKTGKMATKPPPNPMQFSSPAQPEIGRLSTIDTDFDS